MGMDPTPIVDEFAVLGKFLDSVIQTVGNIDILFGIESHACRAIQLSISIALLSPFAEGFAVFVE